MHVLNCIIYYVHFWLNIKYKRAHVPSLISRVWKFGPAFTTPAESVWDNDSINIFVSLMDILWLFISLAFYIESCGHYLIV